MMMAPAVDLVGRTLGTRGARWARDGHPSRSDRMLARARLGRGRQNAEAAGGDDGDDDRGARHPAKTAEAEVPTGHRGIVAPARPGP
jgi:hypothetical protein